LAHLTQGELPIAHQGRFTTRRAGRSDFSFE